MLAALETRQPPMPSATETLSRLHEPSISALICERLFHLARSRLSATVAVVESLAACGEATNTEIENAHQALCSLFSTLSSLKDVASPLPLEADPPPVHCFNTLIRDEASMCFRHRHRLKLRLETSVMSHLRKLERPIAERLLRCLFSYLVSRIRRGKKLSAATIHITNRVRRCGQGSNDHRCARSSLSPHVAH